MENKNFCQSCNMPLDNPALRGTEKDGTASHEYCTYCYQHGAFINPNMNLEEMKALVKEKMEEMKMDNNIINMTLRSLPYLKRWNKSLV
jgi:radical SAM superfamily enzyme